MNDLQQLRDELNAAINNLSETAKRLKVSAREAVNMRSDYENLKNGYLVQLAAEDATSGNKRTVVLQQAMYRKMFSTEKLSAQLAEADYDSDVLLFKGIMAKLNALQTIARLSESEMKLSVNLQ